MLRGKSKWIGLVLLLLIGGAAFIVLDPEARVLGRARGEPVFEGRYASAWLRELGGSDPTARALAGEKLRLGGGEAVPVLTYVLAADTSPEARWRAADVLGQIGPAARPAGPALVAALKDSDPNVRSVAARTLEKLAPDVPGAVIGLIAQFPEIDAVRAVAKFRDPAAVPPLTQLLTHADPTIRRNAARSLGRIGAPARSAVSAILAQLDDADASVRSHAAEALGFLAAPESVPRLVKALDDPEAVVRQEAVRALGELADKGSRDVVKSALLRVQAAKSDVDPEVRKAAARAERQIDPSLSGPAEKKKT